MKRQTFSRPFLLLIQVFQFFRSSPREERDRTGDRERGIAGLSSSSFFCLFLFQERRKKHLNSYQVSLSLSTGSSTSSLPLSPLPRPLVASFSLLFQSIVLYCSCFFLSLFSLLFFPKFEIRLSL
ncbi:hypothetical protein CSUI_005648 [Cystoisospora suis]|uniref:Transmembrane protein n=1 Tax=Cystoisospora suis TaxID=483139 RepID=A0A2C6KUH3_9APIC|nr:hypothetical protein CSUI_005648 [Cystoisospora suis]